MRCVRIVMVVKLSYRPKFLQCYREAYTVRLWAWQSRFRSYKLGSRVLIDQADLEKFVVEQQRGRAVDVVP